MFFNRKSIGLYLLSLSHLNIASRKMTTSAFEIKSSVKVFDGRLVRFSHLSTETKTPMTVSVYLPSDAEGSSPKKCAGLLYLSGLTCNDENVVQKSGCFKVLSELKVCY